MKKSNTNPRTVYNVSRVMKRAWVFLREIPVNNRTCGMWSECLKKSWSIEKNGIREININWVYKKYYDLIYWFILNKVRKVEIAQELTNDVFIKVNKHLLNYDVYRAKLSTWIYTIANNTIIDYYRTDKSNKVQSVESFTDDNGNEYFQFEAYNVECSDLIEGNETNDQITNAMKKLNDKEKSIAMLYFVNQMKYKEISEKLDIPMGSVKGTINRIRIKLQSELKNVHECTM